jgi:predicted acylesterase/phospholipase RssA
MWCNGLAAEQILQRLCAQAPFSQLRPSPTPWRGLLRLTSVVDQLEADLPSQFADLNRPLGVGVVDDTGKPTLLRDGPLAPAVAASCAIPWLFEGVVIAGRRWSDGGARDRTALGSWRSYRPHTPVVLHKVARSSGLQLDDDLSHVTICNSARSGAHFWDLGDTRARYDRSYGDALRVLEALG